jgi:hypothetical protein
VVPSSEVLLYTSAFKCAKEFTGTKQSHLKFVETVGIAVTPMESMMTDGPVEFSGAAFHSCQ